MRHVWNVFLTVAAAVDFAADNVDVGDDIADEVAAAFDDVVVVVAAAAAGAALDGVAAAASAVADVEDDIRAVAAAAASYARHCSQAALRGKSTRLLWPAMTGP